MKIKFCGAARTTTGSQHLVEVNGLKILLDCGLYQGRREDSYKRNRFFEFFHPADIDAVVLSHAHIDHSGNLPNLVKNGFKGNIYSTFATRDLCQIMLLDSAHIQESDAKFLNKRRDVQKGDTLIEPIYSNKDAEETMPLFINIGYGRPLSIGDGVKVTFFDAGHILGSAQVVLDIEDREDGKKKRLLFSGDVGRGHNELLPDPVSVPDVDIVIMESTYGGREHEAPPRDDSEFLKVMQRSLERGGKVLIPSFAVERTQQVLYVLHRLFKEKRLAEVPVFVDSPLAVSATEIFRLHPECFNLEIKEFMEAVRDPFGFEHLRMIRTVTESQALNELHKPAIIISASGMCEAGRILHHLANGIENKSNTIFFVGYCAENTLGWKIRSGWKEVNILGSAYKVKAPIEHFDAFSGHADHSELVDYFQAMGGKKSKIFVVHGELERNEALKSALEAIHPAEYICPERGSEYRA